MFDLPLLAAPLTTAPSLGPVPEPVETTRQFLINVGYLVAAICFIRGIKQLAHPRTARRGNFTAACGMLIAVVATFFDPRVFTGGALGVGAVIAGLLVGGTIGALFALRVHMRGMPQMVALLNGFGGLAAALVGLGEYLREVLHSAGPAVDVRISVAMSIVIGMITFTGSLIAFGKLEEVRFKVFGTPLSGAVSVPGQRVISPIVALSLLVIAVLLAATVGAKTIGVVFAVVLLLLAAVYGLLAVLPIGGADMPVVIALLNSFSGLGAAATGFALHNNALIIGGSLVGAAGFILTMIMCKAMNRSLMNVLAGGFGTASAAAGGDTRSAEGLTARQMDAEEAAMVLEAAQYVVIVPGYGMAVAQAQHAVAELGIILKNRGVTVRYAIHPVAGRMPGHMNVLLAEANVEYDLLADLEINSEMPQVDVALVIGANDVVNPDARDNSHSQIYGMPIVEVDKARTVMVCKRSLNPGFAGIDNPLFYKENTSMLFGDAKQMITSINAELKQAAAV